MRAGFTTGDVQSRSVRCETGPLHAGIEALDNNLNLLLYISVCTGMEMKLCVLNIILKLRLRASSWYP